MTFRSFLFATQALMAEEGLAFVEPEAAPVPSPAEAKERNRSAMAELQARLAAVQGAPAARKPRRAR